MNKHIVSMLTLGVVLGGSVAPASAREGEARQERQEVRSEVREKVDAKKQELRAKLDEKKTTQQKERLTKFWKNSAERLQKLINREKELAKKNTERLAKFKAAGKDTTKPDALMVTANAAITAAQSALDAAKVSLAQMVTDGKTNAELTTATREIHKTVTDKIRDAHKSLVDVIVATRGMSKVATPTPTATP
ncbi:MAG: hypothetical protein KBC02_04195 [Candidatus Pacebacteria bacterium]|nr:hypothetical protein [Candidatus Paceibacterota bacterium]